MKDLLGMAIVVGGFLTALRMWLYRPKVQQLMAPQPNPALEGRLERLESAVEAMTIEMERVSEGQRFTTKLLSEIHDSNRAIGAGR